MTGFTLVELLITIAIIGILTAVVLAALNDARQDGVDAKIKSELTAISKRAAIENSVNLTYDTVCGSNGIATSSNILIILDAIDQFASSTPICNSSTGAFAVSAPVGTAHWCVDSLGSTREIAAPLETSPAELSCP